MVFETGTVELDSWLLAVTLLEKLGHVELGIGSQWTIEDIKRGVHMVQNPDLHAVFSKLVPS